MCGTNLNAVEHFTYLGSVISNDATVSKDLDNHLSVLLEDCQYYMAEPFAPPLHEAPGIQGCGRSHPSVRCRDPSLLSEADQATGAVSPMLLALHPWHQMAKLRVKRRSLNRSVLPSIESILFQVRLRWASHVTRIEDMPKSVFFSELQERKRDRGASRKRYKDQPNRQLAQAGISHQSWRQKESDRDSRRSSVRKASCEFEAERHEAAKDKRRRQ